MSNPFSPEATGAQVHKLPDLPANEAHIGATVKNGEAGVAGSASVDIGKPGGWSFLAEGSWARRAGTAASAWLTWKK